MPQSKISPFLTSNNKRKILETIETNIEKNKIRAENIRASNMGMRLSWFKALKSQFTQEYFLKLDMFLEKERQNFTIYPPKNSVFSWANICELDEVKVVIIGQDPYHNPKQAHGLCFSVLPDIPPPPSLINIYKELQDDIEGFIIPKHGYLHGWAKQGVLLLNSVLTVRQNEANSHKDKGWETFTDYVISYLNKNQTNLVFMLWGAYAQKKGQAIDKKKHLILKASHPSPLSAHRGWFGCKHFSQTNAYLKQNNIKEIDWSHLPLGENKSL